MQLVPWSLNLRQDAARLGQALGSGAPRLASVEPLGLEPAWLVAAANMIRVIRAVWIERGWTTRSARLLATVPVFACAMARELGTLSGQVTYVRDGHNHRSRQQSGLTVWRRHLPSAGRGTAGGRLSLPRTSAPTPVASAAPAGASTSAVASTGISMT